MKYLRVLVAAIVCIFIFDTAQAQIEVRAHVGPRHHYHHPYHHVRYHHHHWHHYHH